MKVKPTAEMNWSRLENARRIIVNLVRYSYLDAKNAEKSFAKMIKLMHKEELTLSQMRALSSALSRNATKQKRDKTAAELLSKLRRAAA